MVDILLEGYEAELRAEAKVIPERPKHVQERLPRDALSQSYDLFL
jgi:hypothetical protein